MGLTPDEIAHRAFTPSVDGYHQAEVRSFLERIATQLRGLQSALPEGRAELAELTTAMHDHQPRMTELQDQLHDLVAELSAATSMMREAQTETSNQLSAVNRLTADAATSRALVIDQGNAAIEIAAEQRQAAEHLVIASELAATRLAEVTAAATKAPASHPSPGPAQNAPRGAESLSLFGSDVDDEALFSDNAIDLLDGVLDDVIGNLTDEGDPS